MRILLIYPDIDRLSIVPQRLINIEPLGLEYLAGAVENHDVEILDMKVEKRWQEKIESFRPEIIGVTGTVIHTYRILEILREAKRIYPNVLTVVGGTQATLVPQAFDSGNVDIVIPGFDSRIFRRAADDFERKKALHLIAGIMVRHNGKMHLTGEAPALEDLSHLPLPRRELTERYRGRYFHLVWRPTALVVTSIGCPQQCNFCPCPALTGRKVLRRPPELVLEELKRIGEKYIYIGDDNLFFDYHHASRLQQLIEEAGLKKEFYILSRAEEINRHPDLVEKWASIGLKKVFLGLESYSDEELQNLNKRSTVARNNEAIETLHRNRVDPLGAFIIQPYYRKEDFESLLRYMDRMRIYYHEFTILTPFPGTEFYEKVKEQIVYSDYRLFDLAHSLLPTSLPAADFYRLYSRLYRKAHSPVRAIRIRPVVSPMRGLRFVRLIPGLIGLFRSARRAYRALYRNGYGSR